MLTLTVNGQRYEGWTGVSVSTAVDQAVSNFDISLTERWAGSDGRVQDKPWVIVPGSVCTVQLDGDLVITGYVDTYSPSLAATAHDVRVIGRSKTCDVVDCSAVVPSGQFSGYSLAQIAQALCRQVNVGVKIGAAIGAAFPDVQVQQGETIFELIERLSRLRALLVSDDEGGNLVLTRVGTQRAADTLAQGRNILSGSANLSIADRFSDYIVKAQQAPSDDIPGISATEVIGSDKDPGVTRYRPKLIIAEDQADTATSAERARWEHMTRAAKGVEVNLRVQGWRQGNGALWRKNTLVRVTSDWLGVDRDLLIAGLTYKLDSGGTVCDMRLSPPEAFTPEPIDPDKALGSGGSGLYNIIDQDLKSGGKQ